MTARVAARKSTVRRPAAGPGSDEDFVFESSVGVITLPSLAVCPKPNGYAVSEVTEEERNPMVRNARLTVMFMKAATGDRYETEVAPILRVMPDEEFVQLQEQWRDHSGVSTGE